MSMKTLKADCPRCGTQNSNFEILGAHQIGHDCTPEEYNQAQENNFDFNELESMGVPVTADDYLDIMEVYEVFCVCGERECGKSTVFVVKSMENPAADGSGFEKIDVVEYISQKHFMPVLPPKHVPENIERAFKEGVACLRADAVNAACVMFRACLDQTVRDIFTKITDVEKKKASKKKENRGLEGKLDWLRENHEISVDFRDLSEYIRDYGNDGAHEVSLREEHKEDVEILRDFTRALLEGQYTLRKKLTRLKKKR